MQYLLIEIYSVKTFISPTIMKEISQVFENSVFEIRSGDEHQPETHVQFYSVLNA